jgi:glycosyltransferase involved in cell wall biosynthesis
MVFNSESAVPYHIYRGHPKDSDEVSKPRYYQAVTGACMAFRAADFAGLRGLDPLFVNGCEDVDFCLRMQRDLGKLVFYNPESEILHLEGQSPGRGRYISFNRELFVRRWADRITPDDSDYYSEDGFEVLGYEKPGAESHGETAAYVPVLVERGSAARGEEGKQRSTHRAVKPGQTVNIGFSSMWYARGIAFHTRQLAAALEGPRLGTHIFARWESERFSNTGPVSHPRVTDAGDDPSPGEIVEWAKSRRLDLMVFMEVHPKDWKRVEALKEAGIRVMCYENLDVLRLEHLSRYGEFDYFLFNALYAREIMGQRFPRVPSLTIPWGCCPPPVASLPGEEPQGRPLRFVHIAGWGGLNKRKNTDLLIRAFHATDVDDVELHVFSQAPISSYGEECASIVDHDRRFRIHEGTIDDISDAYRGMDLLLWPSKREGLGLPIVEALASGVPVMVTDGYMMKQWVIPGEHGFLCPAAPRQTEMFLPEMQVEEETLGDLITEIALDREKLALVRRRVENERHIWEWSWQPDVLRTQFGRIAGDRGYRPPEDLSYIPEALSDFERRRRTLTDE